MPLPNWFINASMASAMNEPTQTAMLTSMGMVSTPRGIYQGDRDAKGNAQLRKSLLEIGKAAPLIDMGVELASPAVITAVSKAVKSVPTAVRRNVATTKNFIGSRKAYESAARAEYAAKEAAERAIASKDAAAIKQAKDAYLKAFNRFSHGFHEANNDVTYLSYFSQPEKVSRIGKTTFTRLGKSVQVDHMPTIKDAKEAVAYAARHATPATYNMLKEANKITKHLPSNRSIALIKDGDLSKDSYALLQRLAQRGQLGGDFAINMIKDDGFYRMQRLNNFGMRKESLSRINNGIKEMRTLLKDPNIPGRVTKINPRGLFTSEPHLFEYYVPSFSIKKLP